MEAPDAALNLVLSPFPDQLAVDMEKAFGIPLFRLHDLYAPGEIAGMYDAIAARLGIQWGDTFDSGRREAAAFQEQVKSKMEGLRYVCTKIGPYQTLPLAVYLADLGLEPVLLHLEEFWPGDTVWAKALNKKGWDPLVCHMVNGPADAAVVDEMSVDICLGELPGRKAKIPAVPQLSDLYGMTGYERTINLLQKLLCALDGNGAAQEERSDKRGAI